MLPVPTIFSISDNFSPLRQRWSVLFRDNNNTSDLRATLRSEQGENLCNDGLRSICWKVCDFRHSNVSLECAYPDVGLSTLRQPRSHTMAAKDIRIPKRLWGAESPFYEIYRAS